MSELNELLARLCPGGVRTVSIGEFSTESISRNRDRSVVEVRSVTNDRGLARTDEVFENARTSADTSNYKLVRPGMFVYNPSRVNVGSIAWLAEADPVIVSPMYVVFGIDGSQVMAEYLMHFLGSRTGRKRIESKTEVGARFRLTYASLAQIRVPLPPLQVQAEIVMILDQFAHLDAALRAELDARQAQYAHYRDTLLDFSGSNCEWLTLKEVALDFGRGKSKHRPRNDPQLYGGPYPFIQTGDVRNSGHFITAYSQTYSELGLAQSKLWPRGTICITIAANIAETGILAFDACFPDSVIGLVVDPDKTSQHFVEYLLQSLKADLAAKGQGGGAQANINLGTFEHQRFPFPSFDEQARIVAILDKFDALVNDLSVGLPAELRVRHKQYEHYRDKLFTFEELPA